MRGTQLAMDAALEDLDQRACERGKMTERSNA